MITGAAELSRHISGQVFQTLAGNAHLGLVRVGGSETTIVVGEILHENLGVVRSERKDSRSVTRTLYRNEASADPNEALASSGRGPKAG